MTLDRLMLRADAATLTLTQMFERVARKPAVRRKTLHAEVHHAILRDIRESARDQLLDERDHLRHAPRRSRHQFRMHALFDGNLQPKMPRVLEKSIRIEIRNGVGIARINLRARRQFA